MKARGFSLVEIVVVIGVMSILLAIGTIRFNEYMRRYKTEAQTRLIYSQLLQARAAAVYQRRPTRVTFYRDRFEVYSSLASGSGIDPVAKQALLYHIVINNGNNVDFDERGVTLEKKSICIESDEGAGSVDSVVINFIRVGIGKKDQGDGCKSENISIK